MAAAFRHRARILIIPFLRLLLWLPFWLLGLIFLLVGLGLSPWGTAWLAEQGEQRGLFEFERISGSPLEAFTLEGFVMQAGPAHVRVGRLHLAWAEDCLLDGRLCLDALELENVDVRLAQSTPAPAEEQAPAESGGLPSIVVPFPVEVRALSVNDVAIRLADGTHLEWQRFTSGARIAGNELTLLPTRLAHVRLRLPQSPGQQLGAPDGEGASGDRTIGAAAIDASIALTTADSAASVDDRATADSLASDDSTSPLEAQPRRSLPAIELPLAIRVPSLIVSDFRLAGPTPRRIDRLALSLEGEGHDVRLHSLALTAPDADAQLSASVTLRDDYPLTASLEGVIHQSPLAGQRLNLDVSGSLADLAADIEASGPVSASLSAQADLLAPTVPFEVTVDAERLAWPLTPAVNVDVEAALAVSGVTLKSGDTKQAALITAPEYRVDALQLRAEGDLTGYRVALQGRASGQALPASVEIGLVGNGDLEHFAWLPLSLSAAEGALISRGEVHWAPALTVDATINLENFALGAVTQAVDGTLNGDARVRFTQREQGWRLAVPTLAIDGTLQGRPLSLQAKLSGNSDMRWQIDTLDLRQGRNRLTAQGKMADTLDLSGRLDAPALDSLLPALGGSVNGRFSLGGTLEAPQIAAALQGSDLRYADNSIGSLRLDADVAGLDDPKLDIDLGLEEVLAGGQRLSQLDLGVDGRLSQHRLNLSLQAGENMPLSRASLRIDGGLNAERSRYRGRLAALEIDSEQTELRLAEATPFAVDLAASRLTMQPFCLVRRQGGRLCATQELQASPGQGRVVMALQQVPMDLLGLVLPEDWSAAGKSDGQFEFSWSAGASRWQANAELQSQLDLEGLDAYGKPWSLPTTQLELSLDANPSQASVDARVGVDGAGAIRLQADIDDPTGKAALDGQLSIAELDLAPYQALVAGVDTLEGTLDGDIALAGALANPELDGQLVLDGLRAQGGEVPVEVRDGRLTVALSGHQADIQGFVAAERGRLELSGDARWPEPGQWQADLALEGVEEPLELTLPEFGRLRVAPDLQISASPDLLRIRGRVDVPWGRLEVGQLPASAVSPSSDEVIITRRDEQRAQREAAKAVDEAAKGADEATAQALSEAGMRLDVRIDLSIGPDVRIAAYGLEAELTGNLQVRQGSGPVQLFGDVNLVNGEYSAFGQDLLIRKGQVLFSGPASQPRLQFEAIRNPEATEDGVIAGLRVSGPAEQPNLKVFSEPAMAESRALSYLLRGRAPDDSGGDGALTSALIGLSLSRTGNAVGRLGQTFGVQDLTLDTAGSGEDSQVVVSGQLFEDLEVSYGVGVFSPIAELTLRYKLMQNLYLEAVTGAAQAVDLIYSFSLGRSSASP
ncbi:translocation/assembly module TamB domain-containing protein [Halomonas sp. HP20-15]|uniref:autotransporter assembly complex protein TamB n=1 Tax=Halomonas sp. HP20-15 TaxID=3085901 RepID=UPI0029819968|nr:translocation/assembly module TamB domain-containing protein [Halomonas sp. HP20-15]MDW5375533.1 translocation/assembly module TamB domain-containing protein [Halomonas sp. HP20-15]